MASVEKLWRNAPLFYRESLASVVNSICFLLMHDELGSVREIASQVATHDRQQV